MILKCEIVELKFLELISLIIIIFAIIGSILGIHFKIISSTMIFLFIYIGSLFGQGNGTTLSVIFFFFLGLFFAKKLNKYFLKSSFKNYF